MIGEPNLKKRVGRKHHEVLWQYPRVLDSPVRFGDNGEIASPHVHDNAKVSMSRSDDCAMGTTAVIRSGLSTFWFIMVRHALVPERHYTTSCSQLNELFHTSSIPGLPKLCSPPLSGPYTNQTSAHPHRYSGVIPSFDSEPWCLQVLINHISAPLPRNDSLVQRRGRRQRGAIEGGKCRISRVFCVLAFGVEVDRERDGGTARNG